MNDSSILHGDLVIMLRGPWLRMIVHLQWMTASFRSVVLCRLCVKNCCSMLLNVFTSEVLLYNVTYVYVHLYLLCMF